MLNLEPIKTRVQAATDGPWEIDCLRQECTDLDDQLIEQDQLTREWYQACTRNVQRADKAEAEVELLRAANTTLRALVEDAFDRDHAPGCSGGYADVYPCKCGFRQWKVDAAKALEE